MQATKKDTDISVKNNKEITYRAVMEAIGGLDHVEVYKTHTRRGYWREEEDGGCVRGGSWDYLEVMGAGR